MKTSVTASDRLLTRYRQLISEIDVWFSACSDTFPEQIKCSSGCSACCRGLFEISLLDAALLQQGFEQLPRDVQQQVLPKARIRREQLQGQWPELAPPYFLNRLPHSDWEEIPEDDLTPCLLLDDNGNCLVYRHRPLICRQHGLPNIDLSGEIFMAEYCSLNFPTLEAGKITALRHDFQTIYRHEFDLLGEFSQLLLATEDLEIETFIPLALLIDFSQLQQERPWPAKGPGDTKMP